MPAELASPRPFAAASTDMHRNRLRLLAVAGWVFFALVGPSRAFNAGEVRGLSSGPTPDWVEAQAWTLPAKPAPGGTPGEILLSDAQDRLQTGGSDYYFHLAIRLLNSEGVRQNAECTVVYSPEYQQVTWHVLRLIRSGQTIDLLPTIKFRQLQRELGFEAKIYDGQITAAAVLEDVRVGDVLEQAYTLRDTNPLLAGHLSGRHYLGSSYPIERQSLIVRALTAGPPLVLNAWIPPGTQGLPDSIFRPAELRTDVREAVVGTEKVYRWEARSIPALQFDGNISPQAAPYFPMLRWSSFRSWNDVAKWATPLFVTGAGLPPDVKAQADAWRKKWPDPARRLRAAVDWAQGEVRYFAMAMGEHNLKPRALGEICSTRFGDCKDKSLLLVALLRELDFQAWPVLVHSYTQDRLREDGPDPYSFNHAIVAYEHEGVLHWIDPTLKQPAGSSQWALPPYRLGLILREDEVRLTTIANGREANPDTTTRDTITIRADTGDALMATSVTIRGLEADYYRMRLENMSSTEHSKRWFNFISQFYRRLEEELPPEITDDTTTNTITIKARYRLPDFRRKEGDRTGFTIYAYALRALLNSPETRRRHWPLALPVDRHIRHEIDVLVPDQPPVDQRPQVITSSGLIYESSKGLGRGALHVVHDLKFSQDHVPAIEMSAFADSSEEILSDLSTTIFSAPPAKP